MFLMIVNLSCKKDNINQQLGIPYVKVDSYIFLQSPSGQPLNAVGGWIYLTGGSRGVVIYRRAFDEFVAFDRHCTYHPEETCGKVEVDLTNSVMLKCICCASVFSLIDGSVLKGPASFPLLSYRAILSDANTLHVFN